MQIVTALRDYQQKAVNRILRKKTYALFFEQRTGKTLTTLAAIAATGKSKVLIICPKSAIGVWHSQIKEHVQGVFNPIIISYGTARNLKDKNWEFVVLDESHKIKHRTSKQSKAISRLNSEYKVILSGTPFDATSVELWAQLNFLNPTILGPWKDFIVNWCEGFGFSFINPYTRKRQFSKYRIRKDKIKEFNFVLKKYCYRVAQSRIFTNEVIVKDIKVTLGDLAQVTQNELKKLSITKYGSNVVSVHNPAVAVMRLHQITGGYLYLGEALGTAKVDNSKIEAMLKVLPSAGKVVIFCRFINELNDIKKCLEERGWAVEALYGKTRNREKLISQFQNELYPNALIVQVDTGSEAIALHSADTVIFFSCSYRATSYQQAISRLKDFKRTKPITVYRLIAQKSIDTAVWYSVDNKGRNALDVLKALEKKGKLEMAKVKRLKLGKIKTSDSAALKGKEKGKEKGKKATAEAQEAPKRARGRQPIKYGVAALAEALGVSEALVRQRLPDTDISRSGYFYDFKSARGLQAAADKLRPLVSERRPRGRPAAAKKVEKVTSKPKKRLVLKKSKAGVTSSAHT